MPKLTRFQQNLIEAMKRNGIDVAPRTMKGVYMPPGEYMGDQGSISTYHPTRVDQLADKVSGGMKAAGMSSHIANARGRSIASALNDYTPVGAPVAALQAMDDAGAGDYLGAAGNVAMAALAAAPGAGTGAKLGASVAAKKAAKVLGELVGAPAAAKGTRGAIKMSEDYLRQVGQGSGGADWYGKSGRSIMEHFGENEPAAVKFTGGMGVTSSRMPVDPNLEHTIRGHHQAINGDEIRTGGFPTAMGKDIAKIYGAPDMSIPELLASTGEVYGPKRTPFIQQNLMYEARDTSNARSVHDIWDARARGYQGENGKPFSGTVSPTQHRWSDYQDQNYLIPEANRRSIAGRNDWDTGRLQASAWVGNKIDSLMAKGKTFEQAQAEAVKDYSNGWDRTYANHNWESAPGSNTGHMPGYDDLPWDQRQGYHKEMEGAFLDSEGRSRLALGYGGMSGKSYGSTGMFEGIVSPGTADRIPVARATGSQGIDPSSAKSMDAIGNTHALLGGQKAYGWNYQSPVTTSYPKATGFQIDLGRTMGREDLERYGPEIEQRFGGRVGLLPDPNGMRIAQFEKKDGDDLAGFVKELKKRDGLTVRPTTHTGGYGENAWDRPEGRFGGQLVDSIQALNIPRIAEKFDSVAPTIAHKIVTEIDPRIMRDAGLSGSADRERMLKTIANEGWGGIVRLVESSRGSASVKSALLASIAGLAGVSLSPQGQNDPL